MKCATCHGRKAVWRTWNPGQGIKVQFEDVCETCYGSGIDLGDAAAWGDFSLDNVNLPKESE